MTDKITFGERLMSTGGILISEMLGEHMQFQVINYHGKRVVVQRLEDKGKWKEFLYEDAYPLTDLDEDELEMLRCQIPDEAVPAIQEMQPWMRTVLEEEEPSLN